MMITIHKGEVYEVHIEVGGVLLIIDKPTFEGALRRGKAFRRAQALKARETQMAEAADRKRAAMVKGER